MKITYSLIVILILVCYKGQCVIIDGAEGEPQIEFTDYRDPSQQCPGITVRLNDDTVPNLEPNEKIVADVTQALRFGKSTKEYPCELDDGYWVCYDGRGLSNGIKIDAVIRSSTNKSRVFAARPSHTYYYTDMFGPMYLYGVKIKKNLSKISWYMPFTEQCTEKKLKFLQGMHFQICHGPDCQHNSSLVFQCYEGAEDNDWDDKLCQTAEKDLTINCNRRKVFIPLDGSNNYNETAEVKYPYLYCQLMLSGEKYSIPFQIRARYTFHVQFQANDDPYLDRRWSKFSNNPFEMIVPEKSTSDGPDDQTGMYVGIPVGAIAFLVVVAIIGIYIRRRHIEEGLEQNEMVRIMVTFYRTG
eukprot:TCONS_00052822-protein